MAVLSGNKKAHKLPTSHADTKFSGLHDDVPAGTRVRPHACPYARLSGWPRQEELS